MSTTLEPAAQPPAMPTRLPLTLVVATAPNLGIGIRGALPWRLKAEMQYFARVTTRIPTEYLAPGAATHPAPPPLQNAVLMGRKTWDSIPPRFRPLKGRLNVVLSRGAADDGRVRDGALWASSLDGALRVLDGLAWRPDGAGAAADEEDATRAGAGLPRVARAFVIGGAALYGAALELGRTRGVLLTRVHGEWECDAFFPVDLEGAREWRRASVEALREWTGEEIQEGRIKEGDVEFEYTLFERSDVSTS